MAERNVDLFCEDRGHELFARSLIARVGQESQVELQIDTRTAMGGHGRALEELEAYQRTLQMGYIERPVPDLLVVVIDANRFGSAEREKSIRERVDPSVFPRVAVGCPDPYVERWCFADPEAFVRVVGSPSPSESKASGRESYKDLLLTAIREAGHTIATTPMEFAPDLIEEMDLYRAGKNQPSLKRFIEALRDEFARMKG